MSSWVRLYAALMALAVVVLTSSCEMPTPIESPPAEGFRAQTIPDIVATVDEPITPVTLPKAIYGGSFDEHSPNYDVMRRLSDGEDPNDVRVVIGLPLGLSISDFVLFGTPTTPQETEVYEWVFDGPATYKLTFSITIRVPITQPRTTEIVNTYRGIGNEVFSLNSDGAPFANTSYTLHLGQGSADVYLISTNTNVYETHPRIERRDHYESAEEGRRLRARNVPAEEEDLWNHPLVGKGVQERLATARGPVSDSHVGYFAPQSRQSVTEGDTFAFWVDCQSGVIVGDPRPQPTCHREPATARRVVTDDTVTLAVWVADDVTQQVAQADIDEITSSFLAPGKDNDIYDWVTAMFGKPWGPHDDEEHYIPPEAANQIHVLMYDVPLSGGYFGSINNGTWWAEGSNERLMFFVDHSWAVTSHPKVWAHEFVHMVEFYQTRVKRSVDRWGLAEVAATVAEDLIADKIGVSIRNQYRLGLYNCYYHRGFRNAFVTHSIQYALGMYLAHNYGVSLFRDIIRSSEESWFRALEDVLRRQGRSVSFRDVMTNWGVATLLSDDTQAPHPYRYNTWSTSVAGGETFRLSPIDLYEHGRYQHRSSPFTCGDGRGPFLFSIPKFNAEGPQDRLSNRYVSLGRTTGTVRLRITGDYGNRFTVVVKE